eukprot:304578_1
MKLIFSLILWMKLLVISAGDARWVLSNDTLERKYYLMGIGSYNQTIYFFGSINPDNPQIWHESMAEVAQYELKNNQLTHIATTRHSNNYMMGRGQFWTQIDHILYLIPMLHGPLLTYDMQTQTFITNIVKGEMNVAVDEFGCLASSNDLLFVIGGINQDITLETVQTYSLNTEQWFIAPSMQQPRSACACIVSNDYLWAFGGISLTSNERIRVTNVMQNDWNYVQGLVIAAHGLRSVSWQNVILVVGGYNNSTSTYLDIVHVIDTQTGAVSLAKETMPYPNAFSGAIVLEDMLYVFGGQTPTTPATDQWMYYQLPLPVQTNNPTSAPTNYPSAHPSVYPTNNPSQTLIPTNYPSIHPSVYPTNNPSQTLIPTNYPSIHPSIYPTIANNPSQTPSNYLPTLQLSTVFETTHAINTERQRSQSNGGTITALVLVSLIVIVVVCFVRSKRNVKPEPQSIPNERDKDNAAVEQIEMNESTQFIKVWLTKCRLPPQYFGNFASNGYDSFAAIKGIETKDD